MSASRLLRGVAVLALFARSAAAQQPLSLDDALRQARAANASLPVAALNVRIAQARLREQRGRLYPRVLLDGDVHAGAPQSYGTSDARLQLIAADTLFGGGQLRAGRTVAALEAQSAGAGYRLAVRDVELNVRLRFSEYEQAEHEIAFRRAGIQRLQRYLTEIRARQAAGQGVTSDVLKTQVQLGTAQADLATAESRLDAARLELNSLMGRAPDSPLSLAPLPAPVAPPDSVNEPWLTTPDVAQAVADSAAAAAAVNITRGERQPQLAVAADFGAQPVLGDTAAGSLLNNGRGVGAELTLSVTLPLWDVGVYRSRLAQATLAARQAGASASVVRRQTRLAWEQATTQLHRLYDEIQTRSRTVPAARDSYLLAESMYNGGAATSLDVLDAYTAWIDANQAYENALLQYRQAHALYLRWGTP
ncbi:MAG TPA: TolC family protein [Gemmatimonadaceae bacterium]|nr:TolC family protein [Gemmatimonadaceae bacterium]